MAAVLWVHTAALGQSYSIESYVVAGGGGTSSGGQYTLSGTVGQPSAGAVLSGGAYQLQGGFWPGLLITSSGELPQLMIEVLGSGVRVSWAPSAPGFVLETVVSLDETVWAPAPTGNPVEIPATEAAAYYRLRRD
jgi:hypothetical protein